MHASACSLVFFSQGRDTAASVRETNRRPFGHGVVTTPSGSYWIINTLDKEYMV
ncbi:hypothetical protein [Aneurinibacillus aneurinilyticus]|uniref:hypothetical protein n=1 Tax=Aneurinibacillus aneurinilyticus TaxID=1391 RepID=UPI0023F20F84|nr:hypothetical protein [Aneurinibacillus aneurinilyticus]